MSPRSTFEVYCAVSPAAKDAFNPDLSDPNTPIVRGFAARERGQTSRPEKNKLGTIHNRTTSSANIHVYHGHAHPSARKTGPLIRPGGYAGQIWAPPCIFDVFTRFFRPVGVFPESAIFLDLKFLSLFRLLLSNKRQRWRETSLFVVICAVSAFLGL